MKLNRVTALFLGLVLAFSLAACGQGASSASTASSSASSAAAEGKTEEQLLADENEILSANDALWEKVFSSMDKNVTETTLSTNYGDFLLSAVEKAKDQFSDEEYKTLTADAEKIRAIEEQIAALAPADAAASSAAAQGTAFPQFEGSDLEGNPVDNSLFAGNAFTVVNFWFNGCKPCVEELDDLNALNEKVKAQGGEVVGINTETLDGSQQGIEAAKKLLAAKGASYRNIYFASGSEAGKFALNIMAFPTTYVFDRDGNVVGQPLLGGIDKEENLAALQKNIDAALARTAPNKLFSPAAYGRLFLFAAGIAMHARAPDGIRWGRSILLPAKERISMKNTGTLRIQTFAARQSAPVEGVTVAVQGDGFTLHRITDATGSAADIPVEAPACTLSLDEDNTTRPYAIVSLTAAKPGYRTVRIEGIQIFAGQVTLAQPQMLPVTEEDRDIPDAPIVIPPHALFAGSGGSGPQPRENCTPRVLDQVVIPKNITVHLGKPAASARNVTVSFRDYIANVASSEVYPTWPEQALRANIHCQISLALNRIYTEWYPSKGYTFNITNSTSYDQYYVHGRTVFEVMVRITDDIFNTYLRKRGTVNPYYSEYCDGKSVTCPGLKQWGTVTLANNGRSALQILRYYYGSSIEIVRTKNIRSIPQSYPGTPLRQGSRGTAVFTLQRQLNRIAKDYPFLGKLTVDGVFGSRMAATVRAFQKQFNLTADGVVGRQTWYKISYIYVSVKDLAELTSEGETSTGTLSNGTWNGTVLSTGASGSAVEQVQFWLNTLAQYDSAIPSVKVDGVFGTATANAVRAFQRKYGLTVDGIVGQTTWKELYDEFLSIQSDNGTPNAYPGTPLREGSSGQNVRLVQFWLKIARTVYTSLESVTVDGKFGAGTAAAVRRFQRYFGLTADGVVGRTTWQKLYEVYNDIANRLLSSSLRPGEYPGVLRSGSTGTPVRELQFYLYLMSAYESSIPPVSIDGKFGADTERAVRAYQRFAGLTVDGVVGRTTWNSLYGRASQLRSSGPVVTLKRLPYPGTPLTVGSSGKAVLYYNLLLLRIAYYFSSVEAPPLADRYTDETATATRSAQQLLGLEQTGIADADTWTAVEALSLQLAAHAPNPDRDTPSGTAYPGRAIAEGSAGQEVGQVERWINRRAQLSCGEGYVADNNRFGASDAAAVRAVQQQAGLQPVNGIVYRETWHALQAQCTDPCGCEKEE